MTRNRGGVCGAHLGVKRFSHNQCVGKGRVDGTHPGVNDIVWAGDQRDTGLDDATGQNRRHGFARPCTRPIGGGLASLDANRDELLHQIRWRWIPLDMEGIAGRQLEGLDLLIFPKKLGPHVLQIWTRRAGGELRECPRLVFKSV